MLTKEALEKALKNASPDDRHQIEELLIALDVAATRDAAKSDFLSFVKAMWPDFIEGEHHRRIAKLFNQVLSGELKRLIISLPPRHTKSEFASYLLPAWFLGNKPREKIIQVSNTAELAEGFGRKVRNLLSTDDYINVFPDVTLRSDSKAAARWNTNHGGDYYATGVGAALAGRGASLAICDDLHTEAEAISALTNPGIYDKSYEWFTTGIRQRLQPGGAIVIVMTRWSQRDVIGQILEKMQSRDDVDRWEYFEFPAILPSGNPLWPEFWPLAELLKIKAELPPAKWAAQYQQQPSSDETAILKRDWWKRWKGQDAPNCEYTLMSIDTAHSAKSTADYSAMTMWGVWHNEEDGLDHIVLLDAWRGKLEFPELKAQILELYTDHDPDTILVEKTAAGAPLLTEFRRMGIPAQEFTPHRGTGDKITRLHAIADVFQSGRVWAPETRWADDVIEECGAFPASRNDDFVDTVSMALTRFRQGGFVGTKLDRKDDPDDYFRYRARRGAYY